MTFIFHPIPSMGQHFALGAGPAQSMGQHVLPRLSPPMDKQYLPLHSD